MTARSDTIAASDADQLERLFALVINRYSRSPLARIADVDLLIVMVIAGVLSTLRFMATPGTPSFQHDWLWPGGTVEVRAQLANALSAWSYFGLGQRPIYPFGAFTQIALLAVASAFGSKFALCLFLVACQALGGYGAGRLCALAGATARTPRYVAGFLFACSPVIFNKIGAGHFYYWIAYATLPWLVSYCSPRRNVSDRQRVFALALIISVASAQAQFFLFDELLVAAAAVGGRAMRRRFFAIALALPILVHSYSVVTLTLAFTHAAPSVALDAQRAVDGGIISESVTVPELTSQIGYPPAYYDRLVLASPFWPTIQPIWQLFFALGCIAVGVALLLTRFDRTVLGVLLFGAVVGAIIVSGTNAPFGPLTTDFFRDVPGAALIKELYHAMGLLSLFVAIGVGIAIDLLFSLSMRDRAFAVLARVTVVAAAYVSLPFESGLSASSMAFYNDDPLQDVIATTKPGTNGGRLLLLPMITPMRPVGSNVGGGADFQISQPYERSTINAAIPGDELFWLSSVIRTDPSLAARALNDFGVDTVLDRPDLETTGLHADSHLADPKKADAERSGALLAAGYREGETPDAATVRLFHAPGTASMVRASATLLLTSDDRSDALRASIDDDVPPIGISAADAGALGPGKVNDAIERPTTGSSDDFLSIATTDRDLVTVNAQRTDFDPRNGWAPIEMVGSWNDWIARSSLDPTFTLSQSGLVLRVPDSSAPGALYFWARFGGLEVPAVSLDDGHALTSGRLVPLERGHRASYRWFRLDLSVRASTQYVAHFSHANDGIAIGRILFLGAAQRSAVDARVGRLPVLDPRKPTVRVNVRQASPVDYRVDLRSDGTSCPIELLTAYDQGWQAEADGAPVATHFRVDGWANGWIVPCGRDAVHLSYRAPLYAVSLWFGFVLQAAFGWLAAVRSKRW